MRKTSERTKADASEIEALIADPSSPVGIDAKKTHVLILQKLFAIEARLDAIEQLIDR